MPHAVSLAAAVLASALLLACSGRGPVQPISPDGNNPSQSSTPTPASATFTPSRGQTFSVSLDSRGDGGYVWSLAPGYDTRVLQFKGQRRGDLPAQAMPGVFAQEIFDFTGAAAGETTLVFTLARPWEDPTKTPPAETRRYTVTVR